MANSGQVVLQNILGPGQVEMPGKRQLDWCCLNGSTVDCDSQSKNEDARERLGEHGARRG